MVFIYDFDGTLTPFSTPQYETLKDCGYSDESFMSLIGAIKNSGNMSIYEAYFLAYQKILENNDLLFDKNTVCKGANSVQFNKGILSYFQNLKEKGVKSYVITSNFEEYVENTPIASYLTRVYGTTFIEEAGKYSKLDRLVTDQRKVSIIEEIKNQEQVSYNNIVYFGDGLTDKDAFEFVHSNGGISVFVGEGGKENNNYICLSALGIIDECFKPDFSVDTGLYQFVDSKIHQETIVKK